MIMAIFSFVGFESATSLGSEAKEPLQTIPRAVVRSAIIAGLFFLFCAYGEVLGYRNTSTSLGDSTAPLRFLSTQVGIGFFGPIIDVGVLMSIFAAMLSCVIAAARVLMLMAHHGFVHARFARTHQRRETPGAASVLAGLLAFLPVIALFSKGSSGADVYGWMGNLAVYGFLTSYALVAIALPVYLKRQGRLNLAGILLSVAATAAMLATMFGSVYPVPEPPYRYLPYIYAVYLIACIAWYALSPRRRSLASNLIPG
jgi:amino acid transporter